MHKLVIKHLTKKFNDIKALTDFSFTFGDGIYGILGPNGAGKSTLIKLICLLLPADRGEILFDDQKITVARLSALGVMPQQQDIYPKFTVNEFLFYMAALKNIRTDAAQRQITYLLGLIDLKAQRYRKISSLSGGMKQRVLIAQALLGNPPLLLFDEPTAGLDPSQRIEIRNFLAGLSRDHIVIITTHLVSDVETIADQIILMNHGRITQSGNPAELCETINGKVKEIKVDTAVLDRLDKRFYRLIQNRQEQKIIRVISPKHFPDEKTVYPTLEDVYRYYIGAE